MRECGECKYCHWTMGGSCYCKLHGFHVKGNEPACNEAEWVCDPRLSETVVLQRNRTGNPGDIVTECNSRLEDTE